MPIEAGALDLSAITAMIICKQIFDSQSTPIGGANLTSNKMYSGGRILNHPQKSPIGEVALDLYAPISDGFGPNIPEYWNSGLFKVFPTKARQSDVIEFHGKSEIPNYFIMFSHIFTVD